MPWRWWQPSAGFGQIGKAVWPLWLCPAPL